ncbi:MAG: PHP domain-containing protein, partial [Chloroflexi bacterium]|nr:PHP domain-containing protein [Chloroflexota bacterium]
MAVTMQSSSPARTEDQVAGPRRVKIDLHIHTCYSGDCLSKLEDIITTTIEKGLDALAITDHNAIAGALALQAVAPFPVIVGEEVGTCEGEVVGLFLQELIPRGLTLAETVRRIR